MTFLNMLAKIPSWAKGMILGFLLLGITYSIYKTFFASDTPYVNTIKKDEFIKIDKNEKGTMKLPKSESLEKTLDEILKEIK